MSSLKRMLLFRLEAKASITSCYLIPHHRKCLTVVTINMEPQSVGVMNTANLMSYIKFEMFQSVAIIKN